MDRIPTQCELPGFGDACAAYQAFRAYIVHEDDLVNQRTTWSITIQSFTVAAVGLVVSKIIDRSTPSEAIHYCTPLLYFFCALGFGVSLISLLSVLAAQTAIKRLQVEWKEHHMNRAFEKHFPAIVGGGNRIAVLLGHSLPLFLQAFLMLLWGCMSLYVFLEWTLPYFSKT